MSISPGLIGGISAAIVVPIAFSVLRRIKLYQYVPSSDHTLDDLSRIYKKWDRLSHLLLVPLICLLGYACWLLLCALQELRTSLIGEADFVLTPIHIFYGIPALFTGIVLASFLAEFLMRKVLGTERYREYIQYQNMKCRMDTKKVFTHLLYVVVPVLVVAVTLALNEHVVLRKDRFIIHPFFAIQDRSYHWSDVERILLVKSFRAPNGNIIRNKPHYAIEMFDGFTLNFHSTLLEVSFPNQEKIASFVVTQSGRIIVLDDPYPN